jgi:hypothetical protein
MRSTDWRLESGCSQNAVSSHSGGHQGAVACSTGALSPVAPGAELVAFGV